VLFYFRNISYYMEKNNPKVIRAWAMYDWANSAYPLVITTAVFPIFYNANTQGNTRLIDGNEVPFVNFFGFEFVNTELYSYVFSLSFLIVSAISPLLSGIADYTGSKKRFLQAFCYLGAISCASLYFFDVDHLELSMLSVLFASIGFWASLVFYNAFLPEIADPERHDQVSARGFSMGYLGSSILLIAILAFIMSADDATRGMITRISFVAVGIWWIGFAQYTYAYLPNNTFGRKITPGDRVFLKGYQELRKVWNELKELKNLRSYLRSFFVYSMGVQTVMLMAVLFADKEIEWGGQGNTGLIISVLIIQFIAILGAYLFAKMSARMGNLPVLKIALVIWVLICLVAYFIHQPWEFYLLAAVVGLVMGGIQSLSRSTYSKMLPETYDHASYFSFYDVLEKMGIVVGTLAFGMIEGITSSMRYSALALMSFFIVGVILLIFVKREKSISPA